MKHIILKFSRCVCFAKKIGTRPVWDLTNLFQFGDFYVYTCTLVILLCSRCRNLILVWLVPILQNEAQLWSSVYEWYLSVLNNIWVLQMVIWITFECLWMIFECFKHWKSAYKRVHIFADSYQKGGIENPPIKVTDQHMCIYTNKLKKVPETNLFWCTVNVELRLNRGEKRWVKAKIRSVSWWGGFHRAAKFTTPPDFAAKITTPLLLRPKLAAIMPFV